MTTTPDAKKISMNLDREWLQACLNAKTGSSFTLVHIHDREKQAVCIETSFLSKGGVTLTLSRETMAVADERDKENPDE